jgi:hypothetical protein
MDDLEATYSMYRSDIEFRMGGEGPTDVEWKALQDIFLEEMYDYYNREVNHWIETLLPKWLEDLEDS